MILKKVEINNYKSIKNISFKIEKYNDSYLIILIGKNETGKSNILEALSALKFFYEEDELEFLKVRNQNSNENKISVLYTVESENPTKYREFIDENILIPEELLENIEVNDAVQEIYLNSENKFFSNWYFKLNRISLKNYYFEEETIKETESANEKVSISIISEKEIDKESIEKYQKLDMETLTQILAPYLEQYYFKHQIQVSFWKSEKKYLVQNVISLLEFSKNSSKYPPLQNIFYLSGYKDNNDIEQKVDEIGKEPRLRRRLQKELSENTTSFINERWPEHDVSINIEISDELNIHVNVQDNDDLDSYYGMLDRSQGFQHFISLLLSISARNETKRIKNNLIVIDEPEVHLHPSGIRWMTDELIRIGKDNYLFVATHSNFMLDKNTKERHYLLEKKYGETKMRQITSYEDLSNDEILQSAFGINVIRDFLSPKKILVEGYSDKILLEKALYEINTKNNILISNGQGGNLPGVASILCFSEIYPIIITDADDAGKKMIARIKKMDENFLEKAFTIRELCGLIVDNGTIEDTLPKPYVESKTNDVLQANNIKGIVLNEKIPFLSQIAIHIEQYNNEPTATRKKIIKEKIVNEIKIKVSEDYNEKNIKDKAPKLYELSLKINNLFNQ